MNANGNTQITIALAKGRLADQSIGILEKCGMDCSEVKDPKRKLILYDARRRFRFLLVKPSDVPTYVEHGVADMGIAGKDTLLEAALPLYEMLDLQLGRCRLCVCGHSESAQPKQALTVAKKRIASKYPHVTKNYFESKGEAVEIIKLNGSVEIAPLLGLSDAIVDIVESGRTLHENGLEVLEEICECTARVVVNRASLKTKRTAIQEVITAIRQQIEAS